MQTLPQLPESAESLTHQQCEGVATPCIDRLILYSEGDRLFLVLFVSQLPILTEIFSSAASLAVISLAVLH